LEETGAEVFLVNTGWTNGSYHAGGHRFALSDTRKIINAALAVEDLSYHKAQVPYFNFMVPKHIAGIDASVLDPATAVMDKREFEEDALALAKMFVKNFSSFDVSDTIISAGPKVDI
jgi:phosphoenolpyruvate carboxykinase (ATP)